MEGKRKCIIVRKIYNPTCNSLDIRIDFSNLHKNSPILVCGCVYRSYNTISEPIFLNIHKKFTEKSVLNHIYKCIRRDYIIDFLIENYINGLIKDEKEVEIEKIEIFSNKLTLPLGWRIHYGDPEVEQMLFWFESILVESDVRFI